MCLYQNANFIEVSPEETQKLCRNALFLVHSCSEAFSLSVNNYKYKFPIIL